MLHVALYGLHKKGAPNGAPFFYGCSRVGPPTMGRQPWVFSQTPQYGGR
ncbi:hypothetical protein ApDm4_2760 [Acetobacter pomorum]|nr:hypothetical protein ApDm4_2760 [Acetobacter pomorum]